MTDCIYIVVTQTGTVLSRLLKRITSADYNHVSISTDPTLNTMYSFGRKNAYNPFWGGFVMESPQFGTFKRFSETDAVVLSLPVTKEVKEKIESRLAEMYQNRKKYRYDTLGLLLAWGKIRYVREDTYYCSSFVLEFLKQFDLTDEEIFSRFPKPIEFLELRGGRVVYRGKLRLYQTTNENKGRRG